MNRKINKKLKRVLLYILFVQYNKNNTSKKKQILKKIKTKVLKRKRHKSQINELKIRFLKRRRNKSKKNRMRKDI